MAEATAKGSCVCGDFTYELVGLPKKVVICHCIPCRKTAGSNGAYEYLFPTEKVHRLSGEVWRFTRPGDSGKPLDYDLCARCGTIMFCDAAALPGLLIVKSGTLDDRGYEEREGRPTLEIFTRNRPGWCPAWTDVVTREGG